jgi:hypothetical protein
MTLYEIINKWKFYDVDDVVDEFGLESVFIDRYGTTVDEFIYDDIGEIEIVDELLDSIMDRIFVCCFEEDYYSEWYSVLELKKW